MLTGWFQSVIKSVRGLKWLNWNKPKSLWAKPIFCFLQASVVEDESLWSIDPRIRRALAPCCSVSLWLSLAAHSSPQMSPNASSLPARSVCTALPSTLLLSICLANTYSSFQTQFKDHFIHSSSHSLLQPTLNGRLTICQDSYWWTIHGPCTYKAYNQVKYNRHL